MSLAPWEDPSAAPWDPAPRAPLPLRAVEIAVVLTGGIAIVTTTRHYRNDEAAPIEATVTLPVPVAATLTRLEASIDGRRLVATAQRRAAARATYEAAIDRGHTAVLHEELLRGVHMLSVGPLAPGASLEVASTWAMPLARSHDALLLRIPTTVGDIYGESGLPDSDDLVWAADAPATARLTVAADQGTPTLAGGALVDGAATVALDAPIDILLTGWAPAPLVGRAADGRGVTLSVRPAPVADAPLGVVLLVDRSGSMAEPVGGRREAGAIASKHATLRAGLRAVATSLGDADRIELVEFADAPRAIAARGFAAAIEALSPPDGGTELGAALAFAAARPGARDVLLVTDGKSHALDVQALSRTGRRFTVVLIGEDSLEAHVGHLAALTGGMLFVVPGGDARDALAQAVAALRAPAPMRAPITGAPERAAALIGGMLVEATWGGDAPAPSPRAADIAALAAALALPSMEPEAAAELAVAHGLGGHLTSLVLIDEAGAVEPGLPVQRKIGLMPARTGARGGAAHAAPMDLFYASSSALHETPADRLLRAPSLTFSAPDPALAADGLRGRIPWAACADTLSVGELHELEPDLVALVRRLADSPAVWAAAMATGLPPLLLALALLAGLDSGSDRAAARVHRRILGPIPTELLEGAREALGWA